MKKRRIGIACALGLFACGGGTNDAEPRVIPGGGVGDGAIDGKLNVHVIDGATDEPVSGASVRIGEPGEPSIDGVTDSTGLVSVEDGALDGPTTVTASADGYVPSTWFGANGANLTIPLSPVNPSAQVPQANLSGTIAGWDDIPTPTSADLLIIGIIGYAQSPVLGAPENDLPQDSIGDLPANACFKAMVAQPPCAWSLNSRTGTVALFASIIEVDTQGTPDDSDNTARVIGFAYKLDHVVEDGVDQSGISLAQLPAGGMTDLSLSLDAAPSGLSRTGAILGLDVGNRGGIMMVAAGFDGETEFSVPTLSGDLADASYQLIAISEAAEDDSDGPSTAILDRGITDLGAGIAGGPWLALPSGIQESAGEFSFTPTEGAQFHNATFRDAATGDELWDCGMFDGRTSFSLPGLSPDPLPSSGLHLDIGAFEGDVDLQDLVLDELSGAITRIASNRAAIR